MYDPVTESQTYQAIPPLNQGPTLLVGAVSPTTKSAKFSSDSIERRATIASSICCGVPTNPNGSGAPLNVTGSFDVILVFVKVW